MITAIVALLVSPCLAATTHYYTAAVVEHAPYSIAPLPVPSADEAWAVMSRNLDAYEAHLEAAVAQGAQVVVFPEDGLFGDSHCTREEIAPYLEWVPPAGTRADAGGGRVLARVAGMAEKHGVLVVLDMGDAQPCAAAGERCPPGGNYFNTQVAVNETGFVVGRYWKSHLYYEPQYSQPAAPDPVVFESSFGVRFGMLVCFDLSYAGPGATYPDSLGVRDILYSTWWINTPPYFSATTYQQAFSRAFGVNLLAAGNGRGYLYSGSGVYSEGEALAQQYNAGAAPADRLLVVRVPMLAPERPPRLPPLAPPPTRPAGRPRVPQHPVPFHCPGGGPAPAPGSLAQVPFNATWTGEQRTVTAVAGDLTCVANVTVAAAQPYLDAPELYVLFAYAGPYQQYYPERFCSVFRCLDERDCVSEFVLRAGTVFESFSVAASDLAPRASASFGLVATDEMALVSAAAYATTPVYHPASAWAATYSDRFDGVLLAASVLVRPSFWG